MERMKTFFKYLLLIVGFFIVSQVLIYLCITTAYKYINFESTSKQYVITGEAKAKNVDGFVKCTVMNPYNEVLKDKYIYKNRLLYKKRNIIRNRLYRNWNKR